jgi:hypothetical protein
MCNEVRRTKSSDRHLQFLAWISETTTKTANQLRTCHLTCLVVDLDIVMGGLLLDLELLV